MNDIVAQAQFLADYHEIDVDSPAMLEYLAKIPLKTNGYKFAMKVAAELL
jgi:hypothetical protein